MPTTHAARFAKCSRNFARLSRWSTISPVAGSTQCNWNTRFAVSTPTTVLIACILDPPGLPGKTAVSSPLGTLMPSARGGPPQPHRRSLEGKRPFHSPPCLAPIHTYRSAKQGPAVGRLHQLFGGPIGDTAASAFMPERLDGVRRLSAMLAEKPEETMTRSGSPPVYPAISTAPGFALLFAMRGVVLDAPAPARGDRTGSNVVYCRPPVGSSSRVARRGALIPFAPVDAARRSDHGVLRTRRPQIPRAHPVCEPFERILVRLARFTDLDRVFAHNTRNGKMHFQPGQLVAQLDHLQDCGSGILPDRMCCVARELRR